jgi:Flp pilus assembly protein TadG
MRRSGRVDGASAVEFALVLPVLAVILFGLIDYGLFLNNSLSVRQGVREAARAGVVETPATAPCTGVSGYMAQLVCLSNKQIGVVTGQAYSKAFYTTWATGKTLTVCAMVKTEGVTGVTPLPGGGWVTSRTDMAIETAIPVPSGAVSAQDSLPAGKSWSWCS